MNARKCIECMDACASAASARKCIECMEACASAAPARGADSDMLGSAGQRLTGQSGDALGKRKCRYHAQLQIYRVIRCSQHVLV